MPESKPAGPLTWAGHYPILNQDHADELDAAAAAHEFRNGMPRQEAEARAHGDYTRARALDAAAHHLIGVTAAHAVGAAEAAQLHGAGYAAAMQHAGHDPFGTPPPEVLDRVKELAPKAHTFKAHASDSMFAPVSAEAKPQDARIQEMMQKLRAVGARADAAAAAEAAESKA